jgi:outer membrane murein-binding lipoprotein Lpp
MADEHAAKIERLESEVEDARPGLDAQCAAFVEVSARRLEDFWPDFVRGCVRNAREELAELDDAAVKTLKAEVDAIAAEPHEVAQAMLVEERKALWPHLAPLEDLTEEHAGAYRGKFAWVGSTASPIPQMPEEFTKPMESAAGAPAAPLEKAGMPVPGDSWRHAGPSARIDWTDQMEEALKAYAVAAREMFRTGEDLRQARIARDKDRALDRWDGA